MLYLCSLYSGELVVKNSETQTIVYRLGKTVFDLLFENLVDVRDFDIGEPRYIAPDTEWKSPIFFTSCMRQCSSELHERQKKFRTE